MILKGSRRSGGRQLAAHLLKTVENEHVEIHDLRGFMSDDLHSAFNEIHAVSKGTRATKPFFSLRLNPPAGESVSIEAFEAAIEQIEQKLGFESQPRAVVFHEKEGRRHAHVVWSTIDVEHMKAINLPFFKLRLQDVSRDLFLEHGWKMPAGLIDREDSNPLNYSLQEWQQARRAGFHAKDIKRAFKESWAISDSRNAFAQALLSKGFVLARGDRRGFVAVDYQGEVYSVARYTDTKTKDVKARLGDQEELPTVKEVKEQIADSMTAKLEQYIRAIAKHTKKRSATFEFKRKQLVEDQRKERLTLETAQQKRWDQETNERSMRLTKGLMGVWHRLTGQYQKTKRDNEMEALLSMQRDRREKDELIFKHLNQRQHLALRERSELRPHEAEIDMLREDIKNYRDLKSGDAVSLKEQYRKKRESQDQERQSSATHEHPRKRGFEPEI